MARDIMKALNAVPDGQQPLNGFDLHSYETFHQKGGMIEVVSVRDTVPNSKYTMSVDGFTRSLPCNTANFAHIKENWYFVHVPLGLISRNAYQTLVQRKQEYSALPMGVAQFPTFHLVDVLCRCLEIAHYDVSLPQYENFRDVHGFNIGRGAFRLFDMLGYGCYLDILESTFKSSGGLTTSQAKLILQKELTGYRPTANRLAAYQCIWYHFFRNDIYDCEVSARSFNFDDVTLELSSSSSYDILSVRDIDDFIVECCQIRYVGYKKDIFMGAMPGTQFGAVSSIDVSVDWAHVTGRVNVSGTASLNGQTGNDSGRHIYAAGASGIDVTDDIKANYQFSSPDILTLRKLSVVYDDQNNVYKLPNSNDTVIGIFDDGTSLASKGLLQYNGTIRDLHTHGLSGTASISSTGTVSNFHGNDSVFNVLELVQAQAIQKWRQKSMLAGNKTADQFRAHHGVVPRHLIDHLPDFIGSVDNEIQITEITSQADTASSPDESNLGEIAGRGYGASNPKKFHFSCDDYGILFLLHAIVPENTYSSFGFDFGNTMVYYNDFYQSEYTNLGLRAVPKFLLNSMDHFGVPYNAEGTGTEGFSQDVGVAGYAPAQFNYKEYVSKVHGMFNPTRLSTYAQGVASRFGYSDMQSFVISRQDLVLPLDTSLLDFPSLNLTLSNLYVHPSIFDSIFAVNADDSEITDEFISHVRFNCDALLPMPVLGLPKF